MSAPLSSEEEEQYTSIIDGILATANLETITRKKIREGLETSLGGKDLSEQKSAIKSLIEQRFDAISNPEPVPSPNKRQANGHVKSESEEVDGNDAEEEEDAGEIRVVQQPPKKKQRVKNDPSDEDAKLAAMLQAQENRGSGRSTRGGGAKPKPVKKRAKKKSAAKVNSDGEEDESGENGETKKRKAGGGFQKPFNLSEELADITGESPLSRPQVVKKLWVHIKANELQDPNDKRQIICDAKMQAVFKQAKIDMFQMNKHIGKHLYEVEEE